MNKEFFVYKNGEYFRAIKMDDADHYFDDTELGRPIKLAGSTGPDNIWVKEQQNSWGWCWTGWYRNRNYVIPDLNLVDQRPHEKAILLYNPSRDVWDWFIRNSDLENNKNLLPRGIRYLSESYYQDVYWRLSTGSHEKKEYWSDGNRTDSKRNKMGFIFPEENEKNMKPNKELPDFLDAVAKYCLESGRGREHHLRALTERGLFKAASYQEAADIVNLYLANGTIVCVDGAKRARKALGLVKTESKWVEREKSIAWLISAIEKNQDVSLASITARIYQGSPLHSWLENCPVMHDSLIVKCKVKEEVEV